MTAADRSLLRSGPSLREQVVDAVRAAVVSGDLLPGGLYSVPSLAARYGVSATPVREALLDLAGEGLLEPVRNKGFRVVEPSERDLDEVVELRTMLEAPAAGRAAAVAGPADLRRLRALAADIETAGRGADLTAYLAADREFHLLVTGLAGNTRLVEAVARLRAQTRLPGLAGLAGGGTRGRDALLASAREHREIVRALAAGDAASAEDLVRRHLAHARGLWAGRPEGADDPARRGPSSHRG